jgi:outer membrane protein, multidrug efflux system
MNKTSPLARMCLTVSLVALAIISGCMVGPDYHPPKTETPPSWSGVSNVTKAAGTRITTNAVEMAQWWTRFNDPKLTELVQAALATNLDVQLAAALLREARAVHGKDAGGLWPSATVTGAITRSGTVSGAGGVPVNSLGAEALWNLDLFGLTRRQLESDTAGIQAAQENLYGAQVTLVSELALDYIQVRSAQEQIAIAETNLESERHTAEVTREKGAAGFVSGLDEANADAEVATTAATIPPLETTIRQNIFALSILLNRPPAALLEDLSKPGPVPLAPPEVPVGLPSDLLRRRPDIQAAEASLHAAAALIGVAVADFYPQFSLTGTLTYQSTSTKDMFAGPNGIWSAGPQVSWPIFSGGSMISNVRLQKAATDAAYVTYQKTVLAALSDVESYLVAFTKEWDHLKALTDAVVLNRRALLLSHQLYQAGTAEFLTVLDAERSLLASETALAQSRQAISSDMVNVYRALGGGWE